MPKYSVDVWGTSPRPDNFQFEAESEEEAKQEAREFSDKRMITNVEAHEMATY